MEQDFEQLDEVGESTPCNANSCLECMYFRECEHFNELGKQSIVNRYVVPQPKLSAFQ